jgi:hypothetical protein
MPLVIPAGGAPVHEASAPCPLSTAGVGCSLLNFLLVADVGTCRPTAAAGTYKKGRHPIMATPHPEKRPMRSEEEILEVFNSLGELGDDGNPIEHLEDMPFHKWKKDTFKYGFLMGKHIALGWVLGDPIGYQISCHYDFEDFIGEEESNKRG